MTRIERGLRISVVTALAALAGACDSEGGPFLAPDEPLAYTRFINAVPDTGAMDWRFIDAVANSPFAVGLAFRGGTPYQGTNPGPRRLRIFPTSVEIAITSQIVIDTTLTFEVGKYYTIVHLGLTRAGQTPADHIKVFEDSPASIWTQIAFRVVNLGTGLNPLDVFATNTTAEATPSSALFTGVAYSAATSYSMRNPGTLAIRVTASGTTTPVLANAAAPAGLAADPALTGSAVGGAGQAGSALSAFVFPRSVAGSRAPQTTAFQSPAIGYFVDRRPQ